MNRAFELLAKGGVILSINDCGKATQDFCQENNRVFTDNNDNIFVYLTVSEVEAYGGGVKNPKL